MCGSHPIWEGRYNDCIENFLLTHNSPPLSELRIGYKKKRDNTLSTHGRSYILLPWAVILGSLVFCDIGWFWYFFQFNWWRQESGWIHEGYFEWLHCKKPGHQRQNRCFQGLPFSSPDFIAMKIDLFSPQLVGMLWFCPLGHY